MSIPTRQGPVIMQWMNPLPYSQGGFFFSKIQILSNALYLEAVS